MTSLEIVALVNRVMTSDCDETRPGERLTLLIFMPR
jgi:hypothetical protein